MESNLTTIKEAHRICLLSVSVIPYFKKLKVLQDGRHLGAIRESEKYFAKVPTKIS